MQELELRQKTGGTTVCFKDRCTLTEVESLCADLRALLFETKPAALQLDCSAVGDCDLSFIQLLLSVRTTGKASGIPVSLSAPAQGALALTLDRAGLSRPVENGTGWFDPFWAGGQ